MNSSPNANGEAYDHQAMLDQLIAYTVDDGRLIRKLNPALELTTPHSPVGTRATFSMSTTSGRVIIDGEIHEHEFRITAVRADNVTNT